jgi:hypothetical protein
MRIEYTVYMRRRKYLALGGVVALGGLAGCSGGSESNGGSGGTGTTATSTTGGQETTETTTRTTTTTGEPTDTQTATSTPTQTRTSTPTQTTTATPAGGGTGSLDVVESELVIDEGQYTTDIAMTGLLENTGSGTLRVPELDIRFYDDSDSVLSSTTSTIAFLAPGDRWDVRASYLEDTTPARGEINVASTEVFQTQLGIPSPLELTEQNLETGTEPTISATLRNTSDDSIDASAFAVFYAENSVALADSLDTLSGLAGGESWAVTLDPLIVGDERAQRVTDSTLYANVL